MPNNLGEKENLPQQLMSLGLTEKEAAVYLALLAIGETGTSKISYTTKLHTQFIYIALSSLESKGLIQHVIRRGRKKFTAKHPQTLVRLADQQKSLAENLSVKLEMLSSQPKNQRFEVFQGNESYVAHEFDLLREVPSQSEVLLIYGSGNRFVKEMGDRMGEYEQIRIKKEVSIRYIGSGDQKAYLEDSANTRRFFSYRLLPGLFTGQVGTDIWPHALGFHVYGDLVTSTVHYNEVVAGSYKQFFETLWNLSRR